MLRATSSGTHTMSTLARVRVVDVAVLGLRLAKGMTLSFLVL
ncbi:unnamed protein product [Amoebophrya sp. A25]|nr:unnamed protein product [Amoebophrya sp. A25]|eukprot:GSA25T00024736001.1